MAISCFVGATALVGCGSDEEGVASLAGGGVDLAEVAKAQYSGAQDLVDCLLDFGLPAWLEPVSDGRAQLRWREDTGQWLAVRDAAGATTLGNIPESVKDGFLADSSGELALLVDGKDRTADYGICLDRSGYVEPSETLAYSQEVQLERMGTLEATNAWAQCARVNGYPGLRGVPAKVVADIDAAIEVVLPKSMNVEALRALLLECPTFDPESATVESIEIDGRRIATIDEGPSPGIALLPPDFDSDPGTSDSEMQAVGEMACVLNEARRAFHTSNGERDLGCGLAPKQLE
ncbi:MAG: hypothetical protein LBH48_03890 [Bifidobacteriaceae bacterium]|nr:hypothetical protein [Bifidobacteriaceae bacterium]